MTPSTTLTTGFPVYTAKTKVDAAAQGKDRYYDRDGVRIINGINASASAIIEGLQPFGPNYQTNLLYILNELWNKDKHRLLNTCIAYPQAMQLIYFGISDRQIPLPAAANIKDGTELFREPHPGADVQVMAEVDTRGIIFDGGLVDGKPVSEFLLKLVEFSERII